MSDPGPQPSVCKSGGKKAANFFESWGYSIGNLAGFGSITKSIGKATGADTNTPYEDLKQKTSKINAETRTLIDTQERMFAKSQIQLDSDMFSQNILIRQNLQNFVAFNVDILQEEINSDEIFISGLYLLFLVIYIYVIFLPLPSLT